MWKRSEESLTVCGAERSLLDLESSELHGKCNRYGWGGGLWLGQTGHVNFRFHVIRSPRMSLK